MRLNPASAGPALLLTGATGLIGHHLLLELLTRGHAVMVLVRPDRQKTGLERVSAQLSEVLSVEEVVSLLQTRLTVLEGDITLPRLGLNQTDWQWMCKRVSHVIHAAALLQFMPDQAEAVRRNIREGTQQVYRVAQEAGLPHFFWFSTAYVGGKLADPRHPPTEVWREVPHPRPLGFQNAYEEAKHTLERLLREWDDASGIRSTLFRPSCVVGTYETGRTLNFQTLYGFIDLMDQERRRLLRHGPSAPEHTRLVYFSELLPGATRNVVPVDYVARASAEIILTPALHGGIYHLTHPTPPDRWQANRWMAHALGFAELIRPSEVEAHRALGHVLTEFQPGRLARFSTVFRGYLLEHEPRFDVQRAQAALLPRGIVCPPADEAFFRRVVGYCLQTRWRTRALDKTSREVCDVRYA
ncbi:MAG: SDR family oxidoreductase [Myxococcota bacterium]